MSILSAQVFLSLYLPPSFETVLQLLLSHLRPCFSLFFVILNAHSVHLLTHLALHTNIHTNIHIKSPYYVQCLIVNFFSLNSMAFNLPQITIKTIIPALNYRVDSKALLIVSTAFSISALVNIAFKVMRILGSGQRSSC